MSLKVWYLLGIGVLGTLATTLFGRGAPPATPPRDAVPPPTDDGRVEIRGVPPRRALLDARLENRHVFVPPQCYTKTEGEGGRVHNPCFTCHVRSRSPNFIKDASLQLEYDFAEPARKNAWTNLFVDRSQAVVATPDEEILRYARNDNYHSSDGALILARKLEDPPKAWDDDGDGTWQGFIPDAYFRFDDAGFDRDPAGRATGWRAFAYYPFPGTFWPTNGSAGDVLIRLPAPYREDEFGKEDFTAYSVNLAVVEALVTRRDVATEPVDERAYGVDLDRNGKLGVATRVTYLPSPVGSKRMQYVGGARLAQDAGKARAVKGLFPRGVEFLHSVRYLDVVDGRVTMARRMKELRYAKKVSWTSVLALDDRAAAESKEKHDFPNRLRTLHGSFEKGMDNGQGWRFQGFIEDDAGALRPQTFEETGFCVGCHGGIGANVDGIFSFARKLPPTAPQRGWFHWSQHDLHGIDEPRRADGRYEYTFYLEQNHAGDEFRANEEVIDRFFDEHGKLRKEAVIALHDDISELLLPSPERALALNKAYREVVKEQSFRAGRDAVLAPIANVHRAVEEGQTTGVSSPIGPGWAP